jgi:hypothetical protein
MVTTITNPNTRAVLPLGNAYKYDQLNRLREARSYNNINVSTNTWNSGGTEMYFNAFEYDANGNIIYQLRMDDANQEIDDMTYYYENQGGTIDSKYTNSGMKVKRNRLRYVDDIVDYDTNDIDPGMASTNYQYDPEGRLVVDIQENIARITWRVDGKVKKIERTDGATQKNLTFDYESQPRLVKEERFCWKAKIARGKWGTMVVFPRLAKKMEQLAGQEEVLVLELEEVFHMEKLIPILQGYQMIKL